ncbi:hypothetical protein [Endozoicomonas euniceicola]|uniref:Ammonium transporter AmtB-like domain-containing protein n=1 Tax=Endozoicomonas euniceicola TaxID=1234143 RepID=A0ABY6GSA0_9GAMM|nr:hypothetical protein [Endozoicomonas euniceicola]UYM14884.1 hypothetical protein NX720_18610 [Endozoicomonas euniceicola]
MKTTYKRLSLFIYLMLLFSITKADETSYQNRFELLKIPSPENATLIENGLTMLKSTAGVPISMILNTGIWWGVCKATGFISGVVSRHQFTEPQKQELQAMKTNFCAQLAPLIATTETALAGKVSPWPLPSGLLPLRLVSLALAAYSSYPMHSSIPAAVMTYLTVEALSQTTASAVSTAGINKEEVTHITDNYNAYQLYQYDTLAIFTGILTGSIAHAALLYRGVTSVKAGFISTISAIVAGVLSSATYRVNAGLNKNFKNAILSSSGHLIGAGSGLLTLILTRLGASDPLISKTLMRVAVTADTLALAGALTGAFNGASIRDRDSVVLGTSIGTSIGTLVGAFAGLGAIFGINRLAQKNFGLAAAGAVAIATTLALINSMSGYAVYGYPLEQSLSKNSQILWKKFYAPMEYLSTLFQ